MPGTVFSCKPNATFCTLRPCETKAKTNRHPSAFRKQAGAAPGRNSESIVPTNSAHGAASAAGRQRNLGPKTSVRVDRRTGDHGEQTSV